MKQLDDNITQIINCPARQRARDRITVKARLLFGYIKPPAAPASAFEGWFAGLTGSNTLRPFPGNRLVVMDTDGKYRIRHPQSA